MVISVILLVVKLVKSRRIGQMVRAEDVKTSFSSGPDSGMNLWLSRTYPSIVCMCNGHI